MVFTIVRVEFELVDKIPQLVEEFEKWRLQMNNNGEENSPILSQLQREDVITRTSISETEMSTLKGTSSSFYITLAKESPQRVSEDSDESTYDSYHCRETGKSQKLFSK